MGTITGSNDNDALCGTNGNDTINSGNGDDFVWGGAGNDSINGGAGNDTLDGGTGSDQLNGGSGDDTLIYNVNENCAAGTKDVYTGGAGIDTVVLQLSSTQWTDCKVRAELQRYVEFLSTVKTSQQGEVSNGAASDFTFNFGSSTLTVQMMEKLVVAVQDSVGGTYNPINYLAALISGNDAGRVVEAGGTNNSLPGTPTVFGDLYADDLNGADDAFQVVAPGASAHYGTYSVDVHGAWSYTLNNAHGDVQSLAVGERLSDSFMVRAADGSSKMVNINIEGSNDAPVVTGVLSAGSAEGYWAYSRNLLDGASDADHGETATLKVSGVSYSVNGGEGSATAPPGLSLVDNILTVDPKNGAFDHLPAGAQLKIVVSYSIKDVHGASVAQTETITITGTNDVPVVTGSVSGSVHEDGAAVSYDALANATDVDDGSTLSVVNLPSVLPDGVTYSAATHSFVLDPSHAAFQGLAAGQAMTVTVNYGVTDGALTVPASANFTITGTNDKVLITSGPQSGSVVEGSVQLANGTLTFTDVDLNDGHTASFAPIAGAFGAFSLQAVSEAAGAANGEVAWSYALNDASADYLAAGETKNETYAVTVDDGHGSTATQNVAVTITGSNDNVVITSDPQSGLVVEDTISQASGAVMFSDVDLKDEHTASFAQVDGALGTFALLPVSEAAGAANGQVGWTYSLDDSSANYLAVGETKKETYVVTVDDAHGSTTSQNVLITITGTNDDVLITSSSQSGSVVEDTISQASGAVMFSDVDLKDEHTASFAQVDGALGTFALLPVSEAAGAANGQVGWTYSLDDSSANYLAVGETKKETYVVTVDDGHGSTTSQNVVITITGTNDDVLITSGSQSGSVVEDSVPQASGAITFSDVDLKDDHSVSFAQVNGALGTFALLPVSEAAGAANGQVGWTYTLTNSNANYLAAGQTKTETYAVTVDDGHGSTTVQNVVITITGTNDNVMITSGPQSGALVEDVVASAGGTITFSDADTSDVHLATFVGPSGALGSFVLGALSESSGQVAWSYALDSSKANSLAAGQTVTETYTVKLDDQHGSAPTQNVVISITGTNDAPVLNAAASPVMASVAEDAVAPVGEVGTLVSSLVDLNPPAPGLNNVTDVDNGAATGIALTGTNSANGTWWYSTNDGALWKQVGTVTNGAALLLTADDHTRLYFQGFTDFNGVVSNALTFRAWDGTSGAAGSGGNTTVNGGSSAFSTAFDTVDITVTSVNDNPVAAPDRIIVSNSTDVSFQASALFANDIDIDGSAIQFSSFGLNPLGISGLAYNAATDTISFTSGATAGATAGRFQYTVWDGINGFSTATVTIDIRDVATGNTVDTIDLSNTSPYQLSFLDGRAGADNLTGGAAGDTFYGGAGADTLLGSAGNDLLVGGDANDNLFGGNGNDILRGGQGQNDTMDGGAGTEDMLDFSDGTAAINNFTLQQGTGVGGAAIATGGAGGLGNNDAYLNMEGVIGTGFGDSINGSGGNDILRGGGGDDVLDGKGGTDLIDFSDGTAGIVFSLTNNGAGTPFNATGASLGRDTYSNFEGVIGTNFADTLTGSTSTDQLRGNGGSDTISGDAGADRLAGGGGADIMSGGTGNDTFVFDSAPNAVDSITDFNASGLAGAGDTIELSASVFTALVTPSGSTLSAAEFASLGAAGASGVVGGGVRVIYDSSTGNLYYDSDGLGSANRTLMAHLSLENPADTFDQNDIKVGL